MKKITNEILDTFETTIDKYIDNCEVEHLIMEFNSLIEGRVDQVLKDLSKLKAGHYAIVGGSAVKIYNKKGRSLTPDLDVLISSAVADEFKTVLSSSDLVVKTKGLWISTADKRGLELDYKIASTGFEKEIIKNAMVKNFKGSKLYFVSPEYLIVMKLQLLRDKDEDDIIGLLRFKGLNKKLLSNLVQKYAHDKMEDLEQLVLMSTLIKA